MVVYNLTSEKVTIEGFDFINVTEQAIDLFYKGFALYEITEENGIQIEHQITEYNDLKYLIKEGVSIYKEEIE